MPAAAVIPAPKAFFFVSVAVKKLVVGFLPKDSRSALAVEHRTSASFPNTMSALRCVERYSEPLL